MHAMKCRLWSIHTLNICFIYLLCKSAQCRVILSRPDWLKVASLTLDTSVTSPLDAETRESMAQGTMRLSIFWPSKKDATRRHLDAS